MILANTTLNFDPLDALVQEHSAGVFRYLRSIVGEEDTAHDLLQETFLKLCPRSEGAGKALVYTVARSCALDHLRHRKTKRNHEAHDFTDHINQQPARDQDRPDNSLAAKDLRQDLLAALSYLPEDQRTVFHLSEIEGLPYTEIATVLKVSPGTIASRKHHAIIKLRNTLRRRGHGA